MHSAPPSGTTYPNIPISASTGEKPQSKVWQHGGSWWAVMPSTTVAPDRNVGLAPRARQHVDERATALEQHDRPGRREGRRRRRPRPPARLIVRARLDRVRRREQHVQALDNASDGDRARPAGERDGDDRHRLHGSDVALDRDELHHRRVLQRRSVLKLLRPRHARHGYHRRRHLGRHGAAERKDRRALVEPEHPALRLPHPHRRSRSRDMGR